MESKHKHFTDINHEFRDASIYTLKLTSLDPDNDDWVSELKLDFDHIDEWIRQDTGRFRFSLCQVALCFEGVSELSVNFSFPQSCITPLPIDRTTRSAMPVWAHGPEYSEFVWKILLNDRCSGRICLSATGHRFEKLGKPVSCEEQYIPKHMRLS
ncbi:hypothetical protein [uncultured Ruegeria sp.]|uniref:hypothetical protein n=1 Tax=uncultured Ruegeria sp. TaxID=259304 RepID=UPI00263351D2|nr:hypothetical protein [uncultured Ruegeria sp.]